MNGERSTNHACGNEGMSDITNTWNGISNQDNAQNQVIRCSEEATLILSAAISFCTYSVKMVCNCCCMILFVLLLTLICVLNL